MRRPLHIALSALLLGAPVLSHQDCDVSTGTTQENSCCGVRCTCPRAAESAAAGAQVEQTCCSADAPALPGSENALPSSRVLPRVDLPFVAHPALAALHSRSVWLALDRRVPSDPDPPPNLFKLYCTILV